jgi:hypothetical protein
VCAAGAWTLALAGLLANVPAAAQQPVKKIVTSAADLPVFNYPLEIAPSKLVTSDAATFNAFAAAVRADIESVLAGYDIGDRGTLRALLEEKLQLQLLSGT